MAFMTTLLLANRKMFFPPQALAMRAAGQRAASLLCSPPLAAASVLILGIGVILYVVMLLAAFDMDVRLREISAAAAGESEVVRRTAALLYRQDAEFAVRHRAFLEQMRDAKTVRYLTPESAAISRARSAPPATP